MPSADPAPAPKGRKPGPLGPVRLSARSWRWTAILAVLASLFVALPAESQETGNTARKVRIAFPRDDGTLTPYTFELGYPLMTLVYDTLLWRGGHERKWLARQVRRSDAGRTVTVRLRKAKWQDGRPVTAEDVKFTFDYFRDRYHPRFTPQIGAVESTEALDARTVEFHLFYPSPGFDDQPLSDVPILPRHLWEGVPDGQTPAGLPVGSGPYRLTKHDVGKRYVFKANEDYFLGKPRVGTIEMPFIRDFDSTVRAFRNRDIDMIPATLPQRSQDQLRGAAFETAFGTLYNGTVLMFNLREAPFDDPRARQAVSKALDLDRITRATVGGDPLSFQADRGYVHPESGFAASGALHRFDEKRARSELAALGLPEIRVLAPDNDPVRKEAGRQVVLALTRAGQDAKLVEMPAGELAAAVGQDGASPSFEAAIWSAPPLASYGSDFLRVVFGSDEAQAPLNYSGYDSDEFDELAAQAVKETDVYKRSQLVREELKLLTDDAPVVPLFYPKGAFVYRPAIYENWVYVEGTGILDKRSFLDREVSGEQEGPAARRGTFGSSDGGIGALGIVALGLLAVVLIVIAFGVVGRLRDA